MGARTEIDVAILGAVPQEIDALTELLETCQVFPFRCETIWIGRVANLSVLMGATGLGKVNAAITTASLLERFSVAQVWNVGCAGAYPEGPLRIGDVLVTDKTLCGDEGVMTEKALLPVSAIGIPLVSDNGEEFFDHLPPNWNASLEAIIKKTPPGIYRADQDLFRLVHGPSLTVSMVSGDPGVASERFRRYGAYAENMEGSAVAQACRRFRVPAVECRGMSNLAGIRAKETWQMQKSIAHCHGIVIKWLEALKSLTVPLP
jgi:futalosine hydrolase